MGRPRLANVHNPASPLPPLARFGELLATGLRDVTHDPEALGSEGFWAVVADFEGGLTCARFDEVRREPVPAPRPGAWRGPAPDAWESSLGHGAYTEGVRRIRAAVARGEVYQANLCRVLSAPLPDGAAADVDALTALLARGNPAPYAGTVRLPGHGIGVATASPELFLRRMGSVVESGPIKGTGATEADLLEKDYAENVMIVDLVRNDLGRVAATGSVHVPELCVIEKHPGLVHLVSTVRATLAEGAGFGLGCSARPSRPARSPGRPSRARWRSSANWNPYPGARTAGRSAGSTPTGVRPSWRWVSAPSGRNQATTAAWRSSSAPVPVSPGGPIPSGSGGRPS